MKRALVVKFIVCLFLLVPGPGHVFSQDLTGIWKGYFVTEMGESYRLEFQIAQNKSLNVTGVSYSYGDNIKFYGKATMTGRFTKESKSFTIQEIKTVEVKSAGGGTCIMNYRFTYAKSGNEEYLEGNYVGKSENRIDPSKNGQWGDCGGGKVFLRRVQNSDFYVEPFLKDKIDPKTNDTVVKEAPPVVKVPARPVTKPANKPVTKPVKKPVTKPSTTTARKPVAQPPLVKKTPGKTNPATTPPVVKKTEPQKKPADSVQTRTTNPIAMEKTIEKPKISIPAITRSRQNELTQTLNVTSEEISIRLYDNGEVDGDTISVYLDGKPLVSNKGLSTVPISLKLKMDSENPEHTLVMVAENMGRIPPNTSLMIVQDGDKRYSVSITSTEQKNAMVRFRYQKKE
jgi:hypothetical protein